ncbi:MAG: transglycosylase SLT domain-containing protein [Pyrinomonadaceae bacterium]
MSINLRKHRLALIVVSIFVAAGMSIAPFMSASCRTLRQSQMQAGEAETLARLRSLTRGGVLPNEDTLTRIEAEYPDSKAAGLARLLRAQIKLKANDATSAAALLDSNTIRTQTALGDYALLLRARALEQLSRRTEARAAYEQLARDYPASLRVATAQLRDAELLMQENQAAAVPLFLKSLAETNNAAALLLTAKAYAQASDTAHALAAYRRIYFYAPASLESNEAAGAITRFNSTLAPANAEEAATRASKLFDAKRYAEAANAYAEAFARFPSAATPQAQLRRGIAATNAKRYADAAAALNSVPTSAGELRAQALYYLAQAYANARQWDAARASLNELRRAFPQSSWTPRAFTNTGTIAASAKNTSEASDFFRAAVDAYPGRAEVAQAQFELAWAAHGAKNYQESSRLLTEHLAGYADKNTDNRGRAGYWAARDSERAGKLAEARALYQAMQSRYDANWYGYLAKQRLDTINSNKGGGASSQNNSSQNPNINRAVANLQTVSVAEESAPPEANERLTKADQLSNIGFDDYALDELNNVSPAAPDSPRINLAIARILRTRGDNVGALNALKKSYPDYSQMKPEELTRDEWDVFYPLNYWNIITEQATLRRLDPHQVAGLIRQETVFDPRARSSASAYGLMQLLIPTATILARRYGIDRAITPESLFEPRLNIQLGTAYMRDQLDKFGRIEYVAAAYNAGPNRVVQWRSTLPLEIDEWAEAIPFKETRGYVQGVVRNRLQYERLYDDNGQFRPIVGTRAVPSTPNNAAPAMQPANEFTRPRRTGGKDDEELN